MKTRSEIARDFITSLGDLYDSCNYIQDAGACERCPLSHVCLSETTLMDFANFCTIRDVKEFLDLADDIEQYGNELDMENYYNWMKSQKEVELWQDSTR